MIENYKNAFSADTSNSGDVIYRKEKDIDSVILYLNKFSYIPLPLP